MQILAGQIPVSCRWLKLTHAYPNRRVAKICEVLRWATYCLTFVCDLANRWVNNRFVELYLQGWMRTRIIVDWRICFLRDIYQKLRLITIINLKIKCSRQEYCCIDFEENSHSIVPNIGTFICIDFKLDCWQ